MLWKENICILAGILFLWLAGTSSVFAQDDPSGLPVYYPLGGLAVQYESSLCGYKSIVIDAQLELNNVSQIERVTAYSPRIMANLYGSMSRHMQKNKKFSDGAVKQIYKNTVNKVLGENAVKDVLIMNVMQQ